MSSMVVKDNYLVHSVTYRGVEIEFYQEHYDGEWRVVWGGMMEHERDVVVLISTMMVVAGFHPESRDGDDVLWVRPEDEPLWPER